MSRQDGKVTRNQEGHVSRAVIAALRRQNPGYDRLQTAISDSVRMAALNSGADQLMGRFLATEVAVPTSRVWTQSKTIQLGTIKDERAMRAKLKAAGRQIGSWASDILPQVKYSPYTPDRPRDVKLVFVSNEDLGLTDEWIPLEKTHAAGLQQGLELCEWEDGPQLAVQCKDQPYGEILRMAMKPITDSDGSLRLFDLGRDSGGLWLYGRYGYPGDRCHRTFRFVFRCK